MKTKSAEKQPNPIKNNKPFPKGVSGNPKGRTPKLKTQLKNAGYTMDSVSQLMGDSLASSPLELQKYCMRDDATILEKIIYNALAADVKYAKMENTKDILAYAVGKPKEKIESISQIDLKTFDVTKLVQFVKTPKNE